MHGSPRARVPVGHTAFSWTEGANNATPDGHTSYSWTTTSCKESLADRAAKLRQERRQPASGTSQSGSLADRARAMKAQRSRPRTGNAATRYETAVSTGGSVTARLAALVAGIAECEARLIVLEGTGLSSSRHFSETERGTQKERGTEVDRETHAPGFFPADLHWLRFGNPTGTAFSPNSLLVKLASTRDDNPHPAAERHQAARTGARERQTATRCVAKQAPVQHAEPRASSPFVLRPDGSPRRPSDIRAGRTELAAKEEQLRLAAARRDAATRRAAVARERHAASRSGAEHVPEQQLAHGQLVPEGFIPEEQVAPEQLVGDRSATTATAATAYPTHPDGDSAPTDLLTAALGTAQQAIRAAAFGTQPEGVDQVASMRGCVLGSVAAAALALVGMRLLRS